MRVEANRIHPGHGNIPPLIIAIHELTTHADP